MMTADPKTVSRIAGVCARLGSDFEGERAAAGLLATRMLAEAGLDWRTLIERAFTPQPIPALRSARRFDCPNDRAVLEIYRELLEYADLNAWEHTFVFDLLAKKVVSLSQKQEVCLRRIIRKHAAAAKEECHAAA